MKKALVLGMILFIFIINSAVALAYVYDDFSGSTLDLTKWNEYTFNSFTDEHFVNTLEGAYHTAQPTIVGDRGSYLFMDRLLNAGETLDFDVFLKAREGNAQVRFWLDGTPENQTLLTTCTHLTAGCGLIGYWNDYSDIGSALGRYHVNILYGADRANVTFTRPDSTTVFHIFGLTNQPHKFGFGTITGHNGIIHADYDNFEITTPLNCGDTITEDTVLDHDLLNCSGDGLTIGADNIALDCNGHLINGSYTMMSGIGIYLIERTNVTVKNCMITNFSRYGIWLSYSSNNTLTGNTANLNGFGGIGLYSSPNNTLTGNIANNNGENGIVLFSTQSNAPSSNNTLTENTANSNGNNGIELSYSSNNNTLANNIANSNGYAGIYLERSSYNIINDNTANLNFEGIHLQSSLNNTLINNTAGKGFWGFYIVNFSGSIINNTAFGKYGGFNLTYVSNSIISGNFANDSTYGFEVHDSFNNMLVNNTAYNNSRGICLGILHLGRSTNNTLTRNILKSNGIGISNGYCAWGDNPTNDNLIYDNYFDNTVNAYDGGSNNSWNTTKTLGTNVIGGPYIGGNYWSDYEGVDRNGDGLGNTQLPYNSSGSILNGGDYLPLTTVNIVTPPNITILSPQNKTYSIASIPLTFTVNELTSWNGYSIDEQPNATISNNITLMNLSKGSHIITVYANDTFGNMGSSNTVYFFYCFGDVNGDKKVDITDVATVSKAFGSYPGQQRWNSNADINGDGRVDILDVAIVSKQFGTKC